MAIGTINPGHLYIWYLYTLPIHYNLSGELIAVIGNSSNKEEEFSLIKISITSIHRFPYVKDKATMDSTLTHGEDFPEDPLSSTDWVDFTDPIVGTLLSNFFLTYFGQQLAYGDLADDNAKAKLTHLRFGYKLWAKITKDALKKLDVILNIMEDIKLLITSRNILTHLAIGSIVCVDSCQWTA
jgi:hypothetical protein